MNSQSMVTRLTSPTQTAGSTSALTGHTETMDPVIALRQIAYYKDRAREDPRRVMAYRNAADVVSRVATILNQLVLQGRSNGIHVLLGTQSLANVRELSRGRPGRRG